MFTERTIFKKESVIRSLSTFSNKEKEKRRLSFHFTDFWLQVYGESYLGNNP